MKCRVTLGPPTTWICECGATGSKWGWSYALWDSASHQRSDHGRPINLMKLWSDAANYSIQRNEQRRRRQPDDGIVVDWG